jgi:C4-dicarboxylate-specific signal transduction histidine kinase
MSWNWEVIGETGLQFFGKMSASISHEIKNVLAIINENAGLLEDLTVMVEKGMPLDPQRLKTPASRIMKQIRRGDDMIKGMNRFAHSVDEPLRQIELHDTLALLCALSSRFASTRGVVLELPPSSTQVSVVTNPFFLQNLLWLCLDFAMGCAGAGKTVSLRAEKAGRQATIRFSKLQEISKAETGAFPGDRERALLHALNADLVIPKEAGELRLTLPTQSEG